MIYVNNVTKKFCAGGIFSPRGGRSIKAVDEVSFEVQRGTTFGLVGESGCGKTTLARIIAGVLTPDRGKIEIGGVVDMVFQDPYSSLNPRMKVIDIIGESLFIKGEKKTTIRNKVYKVLEKVGLEPGMSSVRYPHQFSGGERQRISIARAMIRQPDILILDEPVSSLDVSIQAGILNLLKDLQEELALTYLFVSHDLRVVEFMSDQVGVMKEGRLVEIASKYDIYNAPKHEYTRSLLNAIPEF